MKSIVGTKIGMTQIYSEKGEAVPVTVISAGPCVVTKVKTIKTDGYNAIQVGYCSTTEKKLNKPKIGYFKKAGTGLFKTLKEFRVDNPADYKLNQEIKTDIFSVGDFVDVRGISKGHGFQGVIKRHGFTKGPVTHGQSDKLRSPGTIGAQRPQKVRKGLRMAGRMGGVGSTIQKLKVVKIIPEENILLVKGAVPGVKNGQLIISSTIKKIAVKKHQPEVKKEAKKVVKKGSK
ncbi:MAG: 50S ribosomal protein L3 [Elusimicrobiota bacterium]|nr:50S ribosomal protein L3 [Elusimicrobiota bacterium]